MRISDWSSDVCSSDLMYSDVVLGVDHYLFEEALEIRKEDKGLLLDTELAAEDWQALVGVYKKKVEEVLGHPFPQDVNDQLWGAEIGRASCRERVFSTCRSRWSQYH